MVRVGRQCTFGTLSNPPPPAFVLTMASWQLIRFGYAHIPNFNVHRRKPPPLPEPFLSRGNLPRATAPAKVKNAGIALLSQPSKISEHLAT